MEVKVLAICIAVHLKCGVEGHKSFFDFFFSIEKAYGLKCFDSQSWSENEEYTEKHTASFINQVF